jgi:hypothetical protein
MQAWDMMPPEVLFRFVALVAQHQRRHPERVAFVHAMLWAMPERARQVGLILSLGLDQVTWQRLAEEMPDLVPRGMWGNRRFN